MSEQTVETVEVVEPVETVEQIKPVEEVVEPVEPVVEEKPEEVVEADTGLTDYILHITSSDSLGLNLIENIIAMANLGATLKPQTLPSMRFPHSCSMVLTAATPPTPTAVIRVFEAKTNKEIFKAFVEPEAATFSLDAEEVEETDKTTNDGKPWTKEQLDAMDWETEFKQVTKAAGIGGRDRKKMTKEYLAKFA